MIIVKVGGGAKINLSGIAEDLSTLNVPTIVVQGANAMRNRLAEQLGIEIETVTSVSGRSSVISDDRVIDLAMMTYAGLANKKLVEMLQLRGVNAIGLSGLDGRVVTARRNVGIRTRRGEKLVLVRDRSGRANEVNVALLSLLLDNGYTPVLTMPLADDEGHAVNSENDDVVAALHRGLAAEHIIFLIEAAGILKHARDAGSLLPSLNREGLGDLQDRVNGRLGRKLRSIAAMLENESPRITISDGRVDHPVVRALAGAGTVVR